MGGMGKPQAGGRETLNPYISTGKGKIIVGSFFSDIPTDNAETEKKRPFSR